VRQSVAARAWEPEIPPAFKGKERIKIGEDESFRLGVVQARFRLVVTKRPKYAVKLIFYSRKGVSSGNVLISL